MRENRLPESAKGNLLLFAAALSPRSAPLGQSARQAAMLGATERGKAKSKKKRRASEKGKLFLARSVAYDFFRFLRRPHVGRHEQNPALQKEPFPKILVSANMLGTGFDCPKVVSLVFTHFTRSSILYQQMRGRGTRKIPGKPAFTMFDFVGVCDYHGDDDEVAEGGLVMAKPKKKTYEPRRLLALDVDNHIDPTTREWISVDENGNMVFPEVSEQKAAELGAKFEAGLLTRDDLSPTEESWLRVIGNQIRANADSLEVQLIRVDGSCADKLVVWRATNLQRVLSIAKRPRRSGF